MRVIRSDGSIINSDAVEKKAERLNDLWEANEQRGIPHPKKSNLRGIKAMVRGKRSDS